MIHNASEKSIFCKIWMSRKLPLLTSGPSTVPNRWLTPKTYIFLESTFHAYINPFDFFQKSLMAKKFSLYHLHFICCPQIRLPVFHPKYQGRPSYLTYMFCD